MYGKDLKNNVKKGVRLARIELATYSFGNWHSIQLSYRRIMLSTKKGKHQEIATLR
jgi:hypothetical protein